MTLQELPKIALRAPTWGSPDSPRVHSPPNQTQQLGQGWWEPRCPGPGPEHNCKEAEVPSPSHLEAQGPPSTTQHVSPRWLRLTSSKVL